MEINLNAALLPQQWFARVWFSLHLRSLLWCVHPHKFEYSLEAYCSQIHSYRLDLSPKQDLTNPNAHLTSPLSYQTDT